MSVLVLVQKKHLPILSILLSIVLVACFVVVEKHDSATLKLAISQYKQQNLLKLEQDIYIDFVERRFNIERIGSEAYLDKLHHVAKDKNPNYFITLLLKDRFFYPYLFAEGRLFMGTSEFNEWKTQRGELINPIVSQLYELKFALNAEYYGISNLISYFFIEVSRLWLLLNILILLVCGSFLEYRLSGGKVLLLFFGSAFICGLLYLTISSKWSLALLGLPGALFALMGACLTQTYFSYRDGLKLKLSLLLVFTYVSIIGTYLSALWFWEKIDNRGVSIFVMMLILGGCLYAVLWRLEWLMSLAKTKPSLEEHNHTQRGFRTELALVMDAISIFNFDKARGLLALMNENFPNSPEVMEQRYHLEKLYPNELSYWACARDLVNYAVANSDYARMTFIFEDTQKNASSKERAKVSLEPEYYHKMMAVFVAHNDLNKAEKAFLFLELAGENNIIKDACQLLIHEFKTRGVTVKQQQYQMLFERISA
jgi:membrane associated rhomboid family serine protease